MVRFVNNWETTFGWKEQELIGSRRLRALEKRALEKGALEKRAHEKRAHEKGAFQDLYCDSPWLGDVASSVPEIGVVA